jgi:hypothetical protein
VAALAVQGTRDVSESGGFGSFDMRPRRLVELGLASGLRSERTANGRQVYACDLKPPLTLDEFLSDPLKQYGVLTQSIARYYNDIVQGRIKKPQDVSSAGALAILHRGGRGALAAWPELFEHTQALYDRARAAF